MRSVWVAFKLTYFSDVERGACLLWESQETWMRPEDKPLLAFQPEVDALSVAPQIFSLCGVGGWR